MLSADDLSTIRRYTEQTTPGPWEFAQADSHSIEEHIDFVADLLVKTTGVDLFCVTVAKEGKTPEDSPLVVAVTGNGVMSSANAKFITLARAAIPRLLDDLLHHRHMVSVVQLAYRKHVLHDESVGWEELGDLLQTALCECMGDLAFIEWLESV